MELQGTNFQYNDGYVCFHTSVQVVISDTIADEFRSVYPLPVRDESEQDRAEIAAFFQTIDVHSLEQESV